MSSGYYYQSTPYSNTSHNNHHSSTTTATPPLPLHLCFFLLTLFLFMGMSWYLSCESAIESVVDHLRVLVILSPLALLVAVHWLSSGGGPERGRVPFVVSLPERDSFHRAGGSPWGVGLVLVLLLFMVTYRSSFQERWFPLLSR